MVILGKPSFLVQVNSVRSDIDSILAASCGRTVNFSMFHSPRVWIYWLFWIFSNGQSGYSIPKLWLFWIFWLFSRYKFGLITISGLEFRPAIDSTG